MGGDISVTIEWFIDIVGSTASESVSVSMDCFGLWALEELEKALMVAAPARSLGSLQLRLAISHNVALKDLGISGSI